MAEQDDFLAGFLRAHGGDFGHEADALLAQWRSAGAGASLGDFLLSRGVMSRFGLAKLNALQSGLLGSADPGKILLEAQGSVGADPEVSGSAEAAPVTSPPDTLGTTRITRAETEEQTERLPDLEHLQAERITPRGEAATPAPPSLPAGGPPNAIGWLLCPPFPPAALVPDRVLTLGRAENCDFTLPHPAVSRRHAVIKARNGIVLEDEGSSNGTHLNGRRVSRTSIRDGDVITIGPFEITLSCQTEQVETGGTRKFRLPAKDGALSGNLTEMPLPELLQAIEFNQKSGTLTLYAGEAVGTLVLQAGSPCHAEFEGLSDGDAVLGMLKVREGEFVFSTELAERPRTMRRTLTALLLEASRQLDEGSSP